MCFALCSLIKYLRIQVHIDEGTIIIVDVEVSPGIDVVHDAAIIIDVPVESGSSG